MSLPTTALPGPPPGGTTLRPRSRRSRGGWRPEELLFLRLVGAILLGGTLGCVPINGGAFEADWVLFDDQGRAISDCGCSDPPLARVAFQIVGTGRYGSEKGAMPCAGKATCVFSCQRHTGATPFDIPPGEYAFSLVALDEDGASLAGPACGTPPSGDASGEASSDANRDASGDAVATTEGMSGAAATPRCVNAPAQILREVIRGQAADVNALPLTTHCSDACSGASSGGVCAHP